jgi:hypothetical protein
MEYASSIASIPYYYYFYPVIKSEGDSFLKMYAKYEHVHPRLQECINKL